MENNRSIKAAKHRVATSNKQFNVKYQKKKIKFQVQQLRRALDMKK